jgi:NADH-quinone oxidoreductase subunit L
MKPIVVSLLALAVVVLGAGFAIIKYRTVPVVAPESVSIFTTIARKDIYQDVFNDKVLVKPGTTLTAGLVATDYRVIDGAVRLVGWLVNEISDVLRKIQNGYVRTYALIMFVGVLTGALILWVVTA